MPIVDSAIYVPNPSNSSDAYPTFNDGNDTGSYLLNPDGSLYIGAVWPGYTVFPDWQTDAAKAWWKNQFVTWHSKIPVDGAWLDMSEVTSSSLPAKPVIFNRMNRCPASVLAPVVQAMCR